MSQEVRRGRPGQETPSIKIAIDSLAGTGDTWPFCTLLDHRPDTVCGRCGGPAGPDGTRCAQCIRICEDATRRLDLQELPELNSESLSWSAHFYARAGIPVLPLRPGRKVPGTCYGDDAATTETRQIRSWWRTYPTANIGLATGNLFDV